MFYAQCAELGIHPQSLISIHVLCFDAVVTCQYLYRFLFSMAPELGKLGIHPQYDAATLI